MKNFRSINDLPKEILMEIFQRLPLSFVVILTSVCKLWYSLITSSAFVNRHLQHSISCSDGNKNNPFPSTLLIPKSSMVYGKHSCRLFIDRNENFVEHEVFEFPFYCPFRVEMIGNSCGGLVCLYGKPFRNAALFNPAIRKLKRLPFSALADRLYREKAALSRFGFGYCSKGGYFKVVRMHYMTDKFRRLLSHVRPKVEVYSLSNDSWKTIAADIQCLVEEVSVNLDGSIYWLACKTKPRSGSFDRILSFDIANEVFRELSLPENITWENMSLFILDGLLALLIDSLTDEQQDEGKKSYHIRVAKVNGESISWNEKFTIVTNDSVTSALGFTKTGKLVLSTFAGKPILHNPIDQQFEDLQFDDCMYHIDTAFEESLVLLEGTDEPIKVDELARIKMRLNIPMDFYLHTDTYRIFIHRQNVKVCLASNSRSINYRVAKLTSRTWRRPSVVGIMIKPDEKCQVPDEASLLLLAVENYCLVIQLQHFDNIPKSLVNFLARPEICFMGINVGRLHEKFYKRYNLMESANELTKFVSEVKRSAFSGRSRSLVEFAAEAGVIIDDPPDEIADMNWNASAFSEDKIRYAINDVYASYMVGEKLLRSL